MRYSIFICVVFLFLFSSCASLNIKEIENLKKVEFDPLILNPEDETNNLRVDVIRQTYTDIITDTLGEIKNTPYSPIGFNLGNGLFYDLNGNICLRVDYLLGISPYENFEIRKTNRPNKNKGISIYKFNNDSLIVSNIAQKKARLKYYQIRNQESIDYMYKNKLRFSIYKSDTSFVLSGRRRIRDEIYKIDNSSFYVNKKRKHNTYKLLGDEILLGKRYLITLIENKRTICIMRTGWKREKILYKVEKSDDALFVYNKNYSGLKVQREDSTIIIYKNKKALVQYDLQNKSGNFVINQ